MIVTRNKDTYKKIVFLKSQGLDIYKTDNFYNHEMIGYNYRMTNICASIGLAQLNRINSFIKQKKLIFEKYRKLLDKKDYISRSNKRYH